MHARYQATDLSISMFNAPTAVHLGFHDSGEDIGVPELQGDWHLETRDNLSIMGQPSLYSYNNAMKILGHLTPGVQALSNKSREVFENRGSFHKQRDINLHFPSLLRNDAVFKLVMTWLFSPSEDTNDEFSMLNSLLTTEVELRNDEVVVELILCSSKFTRTTLSLQEELGSRTNKAASDDNVAHHLVAACHALLLDSFGAVLGALQGVADADRHAAQGTIPPGFADLRLAMVVQICSYMFVRQFRVVDAYLEAISGPNLSAWSPNKGPQDARVIQELKALVDRRVAWFQTLWRNSM
ncbi:Zn(2)-C6 fungal-type DNA-binding domain-containing protein [Fusarium mexicanum]|uniref:Zn(2)-C6 fungal-type DNA-binding domain-containing protein n=1 Tax=Fusarium mexicanum TaxID=751941 RepID=A0A8H5MQZ8_9HYPO|nr:Zn(2)-C6 fungal-type DNA-binding domain-containing protein [Fusarium mexicanum]